MVKAVALTPLDFSHVRTEDPSVLLLEEAWSAQRGHRGLPLGCREDDT